MSVKGSLELIFVCLLFLTMPTLDKTYLFIYLFIYLFSVFFIKNGGWQRPKLQTSFCKLKAEWWLFLYFVTHLNDG